MSRDFFEKIKKMFKTSDTVLEAGRNTDFAIPKKQTRLLTSLRYNFYSVVGSVVVSTSP